MTESKFEKEKLEERVAKLSGGVAIIKVGAATETEMRYKKLKIEDAVSATKAALEEGVVSGGGVALVRAAKIVREKKIKPTSKNFKEEFVIGFNLVLQSAEAPLRQIAINAGKGDGTKIVDEVKEGKENEGYDAAGDRMVPDMIKAGIIDPVKVTRTSLQNAVSAAGVLLSTEVAIADEPKKDEDEEGSKMPGGMGGGMPGMM